MKNMFQQLKSLMIAKLGSFLVSIHALYINMMPMMINV